MSGKLRRPGPDTRRDEELILWLVAAVGLAQLEQGDVGKAAVAVALRGGQ